MSEYGYKVTLEAPCGAKRFVPFHDEEYHDYFDAGEEAKKHMNPQFCVRCQEHHVPDEHRVDAISFGEERDGEMLWDDHYPTRVDEWAHPEEFRG